MFSKWKKYSYADQKTYISQMRTLVLKIALVIAVYLLLTGLVFPMIVMRSASMQPSINKGDRFIFLSFIIRGVIPEGTTVLGTKLYNRGDIVTVDMSGRQDGVITIILDKLCRFFTAGRIGLPGREDRIFIKRIIGLPGDEISMTNFVMQIKPAGSQYMLTEYELSGKRLYKTEIPQMPALWNDALPFSGSMSAVVLNDDEYFVLADDRSNTNDSRTWGPVSSDKITSKALFRYWPPGRAGPP
ncbi:MAG: signal peptidase I [Spirochaetaceae bacterium]|nr:signal peptidase I [Spirochaetaceae bacterium]